MTKISDTTSRKRRREDLSSHMHLVEIFEDLADLDETIRLEAAHSLVAQHIIDNHSASRGHEIYQILKRLIRGLCSGRKAARIGFSVALTESLIKTFEHVPNDSSAWPSVSGVLNVLREQTTATGGLSSQVSDEAQRVGFSQSDASLKEERDYSLGRLFGAEAIIRANIIETKSGEASAWEAIVDLILGLARDKEWLREECGYVLYRTIQESNIPSDEPRLVEVIAEKFRAFGLAQTPEGVATWIAALLKHPTRQLPCDTWREGNPLSRKNKTQLCQVMKQAFAKGENEDATSASAQIGHWNAKIHFAWSVILSYMGVSQKGDLEKDHQGSHDLLSFQEFWDGCVDSSLFHPSSSLERKYWGFLLFQQCIKEVPCPKLDSLFSNNFMQCLVNHLASSDRYLHRAAKRTQEAILSRASVEHCVIPKILSCISAASGGELNFDGKTKTKTVEKLMSKAALTEPQPIVEFYDAVMQQQLARGDVKAALTGQKLLVDHVAAALKAASEHVSGNIAARGFVRGALYILGKYAYIDVSSGSGNGDATLPDEAFASFRSLVRARLSSCLTYLVDKVPAIQQVTYTLICDLNGHESEHRSSRLLHRADTSVKRSLEKALAKLSKLDREIRAGSPNQKMLQSAMLLLSLIVLQVYNEDVDAARLLDELNEAFDKRGDHGDIAIVLQESSTLVDILLSFVSKPSLLFRRISNQVFSSFTDCVDEIGLRYLFKVLNTKETLAGQDEVFDQEEAEVEAEGEEEEFGEGDIETDCSSNVEDGKDKIEISRDSSTFEDEHSDTAMEFLSSELSNDDQGEDDPEELAVFDLKLAQALKTHTSQVDGETSSSNGDMNDDQMGELDEQLEHMFRERKKTTNRKNEQRRARETIVNFKCRVLELLDVYLKQEHANPLALKVILPLLQLARKSGSPLVSRKACDLIREYSRRCRGDGIARIADSASAMELLGSIHEEAAKEASNAHAGACSQASILVVRTLAALDREYLRQVVRLYANSQERSLLDAGFKIKAAFFKDWLNWCSNAPK
ncbi:uncharacterized protein KY384_002513 [Bacidia gigantensis]|uniref:uncharacterized protein n=1 Tax=Bacidia gigantensis TaxID=2732470 RepID=UPI001D036202|nr:uncharacterized protein KY384_002513 [Bacidia gigantensis]KAG8532636.1 hypothetical protein KY384_002513 [Bacidia gigantensis]